ncbi:MAG: hypothetical protein KIT19_01945 [Phycisphaeraceae bacterium]|nr:hypothetical protein [Phycisphaeraceae bacterium]
MVAPATNSTFNPDGALVASLLDALSRPGASLPSVAAQHRISIAALALWLDSPQAREALLAIERGVHAHIRLAAALELPAAITALSNIISDFTDARNTLGLPTHAPSTSSPSPSPHSPFPSSLPLSYHRHATAGRKAIWLLYRLARLTPSTAPPPPTPSPPNRAPIQQICPNTSTPIPPTAHTPSTPPPKPHPRRTRRTRHPPLPLPPPAPPPAAHSPQPQTPDHLKALRTKCR